MKPNEIEIINLSTEILHMKNLTQALDGPNLYIKRADRTKLMTQLDNSYDYKKMSGIIDYIVTPIDRLDLFVTLFIALKLSKTDVKLIGICTSRNEEESDLELLKAVNILKHKRNLDLEVDIDEIIILPAALPNNSADKQVEAIQLVANKESIFLDHHQTGKALVKLFECIKLGYFLKDNGVLFCHMGASPALMAKR